MSTGYPYKKGSLFFITPKKEIDKLERSNSISEKPSAEICTPTQGRKATRRWPFSLELLTKYIPTLNFNTTHDYILLHTTCSFIIESRIYVSL